MTKTTEFVGTIKGLHHQEDLIDIINRLKKGGSIESIAAYYDKRPSQIKKFAEENGIDVKETEYYDTVEDVLANLSAKFYNITGDDLKKVIQDLLDGTHPAEVAKSVDKSVGSIINFAKANKIRLPEGRRGRKESSAVYTAEQVKKVMDLKAKGENNGAIAHKTDIPYNAVVKIIRTNSGVTRRDTTPLPDRTVIEKLFREGATQTAIATQLQVPLHRVAKAMKEYGLRSAV